MNCLHWRELLSARLDHAVTAADDDAINDHLAGCDACRAYALRLAALHRVTRVRPAEPVPDLAPAILARVRPPSARGDWARWVLVVIALTQIAVALPGLVFADGNADAVHGARHLGSLSLAVAIGMLYAAWRPERALGLLPVVLALVGLTVVVALLGLADGTVEALGEAHHVLELAALGVLWTLAGRPRPQWRGRAPRLRALPAR